MFTSNGYLYTHVELHDNYYIILLTKMITSIGYYILTCSYMTIIISLIASHVIHYTPINLVYLCITRVTYSYESVAASTTTVSAATNSNSTTAANFHVANSHPMGFLLEFCIPATRNTSAIATGRSL
jgi:hypothetical protein